jgi:hypothetical protein
LSFEITLKLTPNYSKMKEKDELRVNPNDSKDYSQRSLALKITARPGKLIFKACLTQKNSFIPKPNTFIQKVAWGKMLNNLQKF